MKFIKHLVPQRRAANRSKIDEAKRREELGEKDKKIRGRERLEAIRHETNDEKNHEKKEEGRETALVTKLKYKVRE